MAALQCTASGTLSGTSTYLLFLDSAGRQIGTARVGAYTGGFSPGLRSLSLSKGVVTVTVDRVVQKNECQTCGTRDVVLKFAWNTRTASRRAWGDVGDPLGP